MMNTIDGDTTLSKEMIGAMMNSKNGIRMIQEHPLMTGDYGSMMNTLKGNPGMIQSMISAMIEMAKGYTTMMSGMIRTMMENQQMMGMMQNMNGISRMNNIRRMGNMPNH